VNQSNKERLQNVCSATSKSSKYYVDANNSRLRIRKPKTSQSVPKLVEKSSRIRTLRNKLSEVGCVLFETRRVFVTLSLWLENAKLRSLEGSGLDREQDCPVLRLDTVFSKFDRQVRGLHVISAIVRKQMEREVYDETCFDILCHYLNELKNSTKDFWKEAFRVKERTNAW